MRIWFLPHVQNIPQYSDPITDQAIGSPNQGYESDSLRSFYSLTVFQNGYRIA